VLRLRPKRESNPIELEAAVCVEEFRAGAIGPLIRRGQQLPLDHPTVKTFPEFFRGLVRLDEEVNDGT
jgi:hypothetical protein